MSNVYRIAVTLKEEVQPEYLQQALDIVLPKFPGFNLRLRLGIFGMTTLIIFCFPLLLLLLF